MAPYREDVEPLLEKEAELTRELEAVRTRLTARRPFDPVRLALASPCNVAWESMSGDDRARHCAQCGQTVYDVRELTEGEVMALVGAPGGACLRMLRRADGTIVTKDCPTTRAPRLLLGVSVGVAALGASAAFLIPSRGPSHEGLVMGSISVPTPTAPYAAHREPGPEDEIASHVSTQAAAHRAALVRHRAALQRAGVSVADHLAALKAPAPGEPRVASAELRAALAAHRAGHPHCTDGPRAVARTDDAVARALPEELPKADPEVRTLALACRGLYAEVLRKAPDLAAAFALEAMGE